MLVREEGRHGSLETGAPGDHTQSHASAVTRSKDLAASPGLLGLELARARKQVCRRRQPSGHQEAVKDYDRDTGTGERMRLPSRPRSLLQQQG